MQYTLRELMFVFVLLASAIGAFGTWGILAALLLLTCIICVRRTNNYAWATISILFAILFLGLLGLLLPTLTSTNQDHLEVQCANHIKQIAIGLLNYENDHDGFPPAYLVGTDGKPLHSWRLLIMPELERGDILKEFRLDESWNSPNNINYSKITLYLYECPRTPDPYSKSICSYVAVTGSHTLWSNTTTNRLANIHDGPENTILLIELANSDIQWAEPTDLTFEHICEEIDSDPELKIFAAHDIDRGFFFLPDKGTHVLFADGHIQFMSTGFLRKNLKAMLTCDGGEKIDFSEIPAPKLDWPRIVALLILGAVVVSLMRRPKKVGESGAIDIQSSITPTKESSL